MDLPHPQFRVADFKNNVTTSSISDSSKFEMSSHTRNPEDVYERSLDAEWADGTRGLSSTENGAAIAPLGHLGCGALGGTGLARRVAFMSADCIWRMRLSLLVMQEDRCRSERIKSRRIMAHSLWENLVRQRLSMYKVYCW